MMISTRFHIIQIKLQIVEYILFFNLLPGKIIKIPEVFPAVVDLLVSKEGAENVGDRQPAARLAME